MNSPVKTLHRLAPALMRGAALSTLLVLSACAGGNSEAKWPPQAKKWFDRAEHSYVHGDIEDAHLASENALKALPHEPSVRLMAGRIALAELDFERTLTLLKDLPGSDAAGLRGRAHWYLGHLDLAAEELAKLASDPDVKDSWAEEILQLARSGRGRTPFEMSGGMVAAVDMPLAGTAMLVPLEINGEPALAMVATDRAESVIDSRAANEGGWVSLRFAGRLEVSDVPAVAQDLSGLSREIGAPVKLLIGVHLLRRLRATIDLAGRQFVVRNYEPPAPPQATTIHPIFYRGGAMVLPGAFGTARTAPSSSLLVNTSMAFPLALDEAAWKKAGVDSSTFAGMPGGGDLRHGILPMLRLGAFEIPNVPGVYGAPIEAVEKQVGVDLDGFAGAGLFGTFRLTFADRGKTLWLEDLPLEVVEMRRRLAAEAHAAARARSSQPSAGASMGPPIAPEKTPTPSTPSTPSTAAKPLAPPAPPQPKGRP